MPTIIRSIQEWRELRKRLTTNLGFVPTMGYLHKGHLSLIQKAKSVCDHVVLSIFVNPLQFGPNEDFERYPRDEARDIALAKEAGADFIFIPTVKEMYPQKMLTSVHMTGITEKLCGESRPGHFDGVATVVSKLFHIIQPDIAFFGQKDIQQAAVIEALVRDLNFPVKIEVCSTVREEDGLALSSRNVYLTPEEREQAPILYQALTEAELIIRAGERDPHVIQGIIMDKIMALDLARIDYVELVSYPDFKPLTELTGQMVIAVAVFFGKTRLIDNILIRIS